MFDQLPETNPARNPAKPKALFAAGLFYVALVATIVVAQMLVPERLGPWQLISTIYMAPPPPPASVSEPGPLPAAKPPKQTESVTPIIPKEPELAMPTLPTPSLDENPGTEQEANEGAPPVGTGGSTDGIAGGVAGSMGPVRVGGLVREPRLIKMVKPEYPREAAKEHIGGQVVLEATVTANGTVEDVRVISGPPMLIQAALEAVRQWKYEPTILNGQPVPVILTARVNFLQSK